MQPKRAYDFYEVVRVCRMPLSGASSIKNFLITYEFQSTAVDYEKLYSAIRSIPPGDNAHQIMLSVWMVKSTLNAQQILEHLRATHAMTATHYLIFETGQYFGEKEREFWHWFEPWYRDKIQ